MAAVENSFIFFDFEIQDSDLYQSRLEAYQRGCLFKERNAAAFGWNDHTKSKTILDAYQEMDGSESISLEPPKHEGARLIVELDPKSCPKTCENFVALAEGNRGNAKTKGKKGATVALHYRGCSIFRIEPGVLCQTGDFTRDDGSGGESIWNKRFNDEKEGLKKKHTRRGVVGMANSGKNSNTSQFYITFAPLPQLDGKHVIFGEITSDTLENLTLIENAASSLSKGVVVRIINSGIIQK